MRSSQLKIEKIGAHHSAMVQAYSLMIGVIRIEAISLYSLLPTIAANMIEIANRVSLSFVEPQREMVSESLITKFFKC
jgi:hypothetical protein